MLCSDVISELYQLNQIKAKFIFRFDVVGSVFRKSDFLSDAAHLGENVFASTMGFEKLIYSQAWPLHT